MIVTPLALFLLAAPPPPGGAPSASDDAVTRLQATYAATDDLTADFEQVYTYRVGGLQRRSTGRIFLKKPGRMRWDYLTPGRRHFISDGTTLWVYEPEQQQAFRDNLGRSQAASALQFLLGGGNVAETFRHRLLEPAASGALRLELVPRRSEAHYRRVVLSLDPRAFRVVGTEVEDPTGNVNTLTFTRLQANQGLPEGGFAFTPPEGTRVIHAPEAPEASAEGTR